MKGKKGGCLFSSVKIILINHSPVRDKFWIFECMMEQLNKKKEKWKEKCDSMDENPKRAV